MSAKRCLKTDCYEAMCKRRKEIESNQEFIHDNLTCRKCRKKPTGFVYHCSKFHLLCHGCTNKNAYRDTCMVCNEVFLPTSNPLIQAVCNQMSLMCKFTGCGKEFNAIAEMDKHELECVHRDFKCLKCKKECESADEMYNHLKVCDFFEISYTNEDFEKRIKELMASVQEVGETCMIKKIDGEGPVVLIGCRVDMEKNDDLVFWGKILAHDTDSEARLSVNLYGKEATNYNSLCSFDLDKWNVDYNVLMEDPSQHYRASLGLLENLGDWHISFMVN